MPLDADSRRQEASRVADALITAIELGTLAPRDAALRASRLARLLDDADAMGWLSFEIRGYPRPLTADAVRAASRSGREVVSEDGPTLYNTATLASLAADARGLDQNVQQTGSVSGDWAYRVEIERRAERKALRETGREAQRLLDRIAGEIHAYASARYQELRFGAAAEGAFELLRQEVDTAIGEIVPDALPMLSAAFENAGSDNPENWAAAAATCRRLLKTVADRLRPPGDDIERDGRPIKMGDGNYINRLVDWLQASGTGQTTAEVVTADLEYLGRRLDAFDGAGQKGAHASVSKLEASRYITGTYLVLGDILRRNVLHPTPADNQ